MTITKFSFGLNNIYVIDDEIFTNEQFRVIENALLTEDLKKKLVLNGTITINIEVENYENDDTVPF